MRFEGLNSSREARLEDAPDFFDESALKHPPAPRVEPLIERVTRWFETDLERSVPGERVTPVAEQVADGVAHHKAQFQSSGHLGHVVRMDSGRSRRIQALQNPVEASAVAPLPSGETVAQVLIARGSWQQAIQQGAQVKPRPAGDHRDFSPRGDVCQNSPRSPCIFAGRKQLVRLGDVDQVMCDTAARFEREFSGAEVKKPVHLQGIAIHDFPAKYHRNFQCQIALTRTGRTQHGNQRKFWCV
jgi:hypothetical protein